MFGVEKEKGKVEGIIAAVCQNVFGGDVYPSLEEKAANLLYFMIKDHPFADGCKRIAASLFLEFLSRNKILNGRKRVGKTYLVRETFNNIFTFQHSGLAKDNARQQLQAFTDSLEEAGLKCFNKPNDCLEAFKLLICALALYGSFRLKTNRRR